MRKNTRIVVIDECCHKNLVAYLSRTYNVVVPRQGMTDDEILELAIMLDGYILTYDYNFPEYSKLIRARGYSDAKYKTRFIK